MPRQKPGESDPDVGTDPKLLRAVRRLLGIRAFDCDLAASPQNAVAQKFYTKSDDALRQPWRVGSGWNWLNPPFDEIEPWVKRAYLQSSAANSAQTAMLVPLGCPDWWRFWVHHKARVMLLNGRLTFVGHSDPYPKDCAILLYGPYVKTSYEVWVWGQQ